MLSLTFDTDWVPEEVLADTMDLLAQAGQRATFFCTSPYSASLFNGHETALHPNYFDDELSELEQLGKLKALYPDAIGVRAHGLIRLELSKQTSLHWGKVL